MSRIKVISPSRISVVCISVPRRMRDLICYASDETELGHWSALIHRTSDRRETRRRSDMTYDMTAVQSALRVVAVLQDALIVSDDELRFD